MSQALRMVSSDGERRGPVRIAGRFGAGIRRQGQTGEPATIMDLSSGGCQVEVEAPVAAGTNIWIKASAFPAKPIFARVIWSRGCLAGCEFVTPLAHADLGRLLSRASVDA